jgi:integrase
VKKRANGEGSVYRTGDGAWRAAVRGGKPSFRAETRELAIRKRDEYLRSHRQTISLPKRARDSFAALLATWLDSRADALRPRTLESYRYTAERYIIPSIGDVPIGRLSPDHIRSAMSLASSPRTKNYVRSICHLALEYAVDHDTLARNVARKVDPVAGKRTEREMPSETQWTALLGAIGGEAIATRAVLLVIAYCGLRVGEACGLRWVDYSDGQLAIRRAADRQGNLVPVKTAAGRRVVPVGRRVEAALGEWYAVQAELRVTHTDRWRDVATPDLMFTTRYGGPWNQRNILRAAHRVTEKAGLGKRSVHYLRHMAISHLIADPEVDIKTVQAIAGHSSIRVTMDTYGHLIPGRLQVAAKAMDRKG